MPLRRYPSRFLKSIASKPGNALPAAKTVRESLSGLTVSEVVKCAIPSAAAHLLVRRSEKRKHAGQRFPRSGSASSPETARRYAS